MKVLTIIAMALVVTHGQQPGNQKENFHIPFNWERCTSSGCTPQTGSVALDANWRWFHNAGGYENCFDGNEWIDQYCPDPQTCTTGCELEGVPSEEWANPYGITQSNPSELNIQFVTQGIYSTNIGSRVYLLDESEENYVMFQLLNKEITFDVEVDELGCGLNGAVYLVEMDEDGGKSEFPENTAGAAYGTGYCDAQCPHDIKYINGLTNSDGWEPADNDPNSGKGRYGVCCPEMDLWEANSLAQAYTSHPCSVEGYTRCEDNSGEPACGDDDNRYGGVCDKDGCDFASYRLGDENFYGPGSQYTVDTTQKMTVVTQFLTSDGTENGDLVEIRRKYVQNGNVIENSKVNFPGTTDYDSITDDMCSEVKSLFGDPNDHLDKGGLKAMGDALRRGMVFVMSMWDDHTAAMLWLDSIYPPGGDENQPGVKRGPCPPDSGDPIDVEEQFADSHVIFSNLKFGDLDTTY